MELNYQKKLTNYNITDLKDPILDGKFVSKARTFETAMAKGTLTPEEIEATDEELCKLFDELHEFEEVDAPEVDQLKTQNLILSVKEEANATSDLQELTDLANKYKSYPEIVAFIDKRAEVVTKEIARQQEEEKLAKEKEEADKVTKEKIIEHTQNSLQSKLLKKEYWKYSELEEIGVKPTDKDMIVDGVYLEQQFLFKIYKVKGLVQNTD